MPLPKDQAWFPRKTYGYGWGFPSKWQGWVVMLAFFVALAAGGAVLDPSRPGWFTGYAFVLAGILMASCYWKGEAPGWRWGGKK